MMKKFFRKFLVFALVLVMAAGVLPNISEVSAASKPKTPKITVTVSEDGTSLTVAIAKTKKADGYQIVVKLPGSEDFTEVTLLEENGKKKRTFTVENLLSGTYSIKVRGYKNSKGKKVWGKYSKVQTVTVAGKSNAAYSVGDIVTFGSYEQDNNTENGNEPIEWIVLSNESDKLFMVSVFALDGGNMVQQNDNDPSYDESGKEYYPWEKTKVRKFLNYEFVEKAFTDEETAIIEDTKLEDTNTVDKVFLLSKDEVENLKYEFERKEDRRCAPTEWALNPNGKPEKDRYVWVWNEDYDNLYYANADALSCFWWLRTLYTDNHCYYVVTDEGEFSHGDPVWGDVYSGRDNYDEDIDEEEITVDEGFGIRPAIVVSLGEAAGKLITKTGKTVKEEWSTAKTVELGYESVYAAMDDDDDYYDDDDWDDYDEDYDNDDEDWDDWESSWYYDDVVNPDKYIKKTVKKISKAKKGDIIQFGSYEQDNNLDNGKEPIEWIVLEKTKTELFVVSLYAIECMTKNDSDFTEWENCSLRKWLNDTFYKTAFNKSERKKIKETELENKAAELGLYGNDTLEEDRTLDKVFLLSYDDLTNTDYGFMKDAFESDFYRRASVTPYAISKEDPKEGRPLVEEGTNKTIYGEDSCGRWLLRTTGLNNGNASWVVCGTGRLDDAFKSYWTAGIRPAIKISLK